MLRDIWFKGPQRDTFAFSQAPNLPLLIGAGASGQPQVTAAATSAEDARGLILALIDWQYRLFSVATELKATFTAE